MSSWAYKRPVLTLGFGELVICCLAEHTYKCFWCHLLLNRHLMVINLHYMCYCLLFFEGYFVADAVAYYQACSAHMFHCSSSTCWCFIDTNPLCVHVLVPRTTDSWHLVSFNHYYSMFGHNPLISLDKYEVSLILSLPMILSLPGF